MTPLFLASAISDSIWFSIQSLVPSGILTLVDAAARALLVACIVGAGLRLTAARHVPAQKAAWGLVLAGALLMPIMAPWAGSAAWVPAGATWVVPTHTWAEFVVSRASAFTPAKETIRVPRALRSLRAVEHVPVAAAPTGNEPAEVPASGASQPDRFPAPTISYSQTGGADLPTRTSQSGFTFPISDLVWMIYSGVCLGLLLRLAYGLGGAIGLWQSAEPVYLDPQLAGGLRLRSSRKITSPVTVGSAVVLPADYDEWDTQKLRIVLAHERSHVRQGDFYLQALAGLYTALFWFSPLGWWLKRKLSDLSETISDRAGLEEAPSHASYARILLEFAALPRRAQVGVAMARTGGIAQRIERLLNEHSFRQAFAGGRRRLLAALLLVPMALFAATALIRVQAAQTLQHPVSAQGPVVVQSHPETTPEIALQSTPATASEGQTPQAQPSQVPPPEDADEAQAPVTPSTPVPPSTPAPAPAGAPQAAPAAPPAPPSSDEDADQDQTVTTNQCNSRASTRSFTHMSSRKGYSYWSSNGDSYALISGSDQSHLNFTGEWSGDRRAEIDKARSMAHGAAFLWFTHDGKSYVVDDPRTIAFIETLYKPMEELGQKQRELGEKQRELGDQQRELGRRQREASIPTPDVSREMAQLNAAIAKLQAQKNGTITIEQLAEVQGKIGELQGKLGGIYGQIGSRQGELGREQGRLGERQGILGEEQGRLGEEQVRLSREADTKVHSIIDQSLKDGRAKPVE